jgi:hypothetical protein
VRHIWQDVALSEPLGLNVIASQSVHVGFVLPLPAVMTCWPAPQAHMRLLSASPGSVCTEPRPPVPHVL